MERCQDWRTFVNMLYKCRAEMMEHFILGLSMEYTCFYAKGLIEDISKICKLQSELVTRALESADENVIENEKRRILLENEAAKINIRRKSVMQLQEKIFGNGFKGQININPTAFSEIDLKTVKHFIKSQYCLKPCMIYSGRIRDIMPCAILEKRKPGIKNLCAKREERIKSGLYQLGRFFCIALDPIEGVTEYFQLKILLEIYDSIWNTYYDEKIISTAVKLFERKTLLIFELRAELAGSFDYFLNMKEADFFRHFQVSVQKVKLNTLSRLHDLAAYNMFLYKAYRYLDEVCIDFSTIKDIFLNIYAEEILNAHKRIVQQIGTVFE